MKYAISLVLCLSLSGCIGPQFLKVQRYKYNEAIQESTAEQLLLNIVRLRYNDSPMFLNVGDIDARFSLDASSMASGTINENVGAAPLNANSAMVTASSGFTNNPNIKLSPMQDADFARLLVPLTHDEMLALATRRVYLYEYLALAMQTYTYKPDDDDKKETVVEEITVDAHRNTSKWMTFLEKLKANDEEGLIVIGSEMVETEELLPRFAADAIAPKDVIKAKLAGLTFKTFKDPDNQGKNQGEEEYVLVGKTQEWTMKVRRSVVNPEITEDPGITQLREAQDLVRHITAQLREAPESRSRITAELQEAEEKVQETRKTLEEQELVPVRFAPKDEDEVKNEINVRSRSIVQMMSFLSHGVEVPSAHENEGKKEQDQPGIPGFKVEHQVHRPSDAFVSVKYRDHWFYLKREDTVSKKFFSVLTELFVERAGKAATTPTVLPL